MWIRPAAEADLPLLRDIERAAGRCFRAVGMAEIADDEPLSVGDLDAFRRAGLAWVAVERAERGLGRVVAYLVAARVDGNLHVEQVSVHPDAARRGIGRALIDHAARHAAELGVPALTLTTFSGVPWNAPYYRRIGFRTLRDHEITPELGELCRREAEHGLDRWPRECMTRPV
ncbi:GNAT family N-acetyltransferase [Yinghuangia sp. ASG 101]|uniref:GNAT family N-acetyltransferase n=1 Tax=Yinghuangia sp. ASG 101 TaxID=2896848 RepID=UPI001E50C10B|nr:GNAT family N-acetyltransferase [Yinghuangia sp. ASG 101]UGQ10756.1 GNAT family N-acetyltransferase [Yinghuangia sp. ASG 101]